jgi:peptide/nickel transport system substrate-binding protein
LTPSEAPVSFRTLPPPIPAGNGSHLRNFRFGRALLGFLLLSPALLAPWACSRRSQSETAAASRPAPETRAGSAQDPNAENPERDSWVDLATIPFDKRLVGGRFVQLKPTLFSSINAVARVSADAERLHKYLLGAPLLMEAPDWVRGGVELQLHGAARMPEDSPDHLTQVWTLRPDLTWEDGKPVTAKDYAFTFRMIRTPDVQTSIRGSLDAIASIDAIDDLRFKVTWKTPQWRAIAKIGVDFQVVPAHAMPQDAASFNKLTTHLACGPYRVAAFEPSKRVEVVLRDEYRKKPFPIHPNYVESFVWELGIGDPLAKLTRLTNGEAHLVDLTSDQYARQGVEPTFRAVAWRTAFAMPSYSFLAWNLKDPADLSRPHPVLGDLRVRRALSHLIPLETLAATAFHGLARPVSGPFDWRDSGYDASIAPIAFDPPKAAALLKEAGWAPGPDGLLAKDGRPCKLTLLREIQSGPLNSIVAQTFQEEARRIGVTVVLAEAGRKFYDELGAHRFDAGMVLWQIDFIEPDVSREWHSRFAVKGGYNYSGFADPDVDRLFDGHEATFDPAARVKIRRELHRRIHDATPAAFLLTNETTIGVSKRFANVKVHDFGVRYHDFVLRDLWEKYRPR